MKNLLLVAILCTVAMPAWAGGSSGGNTGTVRGPASSTVGHVTTWANTAGTLLQDNSNTITITPTTAPLILSNGGVTLPGLISNTDLEVITASGSPKINIDSFGGVPNFYGRRADGTSASPTAVQQNDVLWVGGGLGYGATTYSSIRAGMQVMACQNWTDAVQCAELQFAGTPLGSTTEAVWASFYNGHLLINSVSDDGVDYLQVAGGARVAGINYSGTAPTVSACGTTPSIDANATNYSGRVTVGTVAAASCTVTFASSGFVSFNHCRVTPETALATFGYTYSLTVLTVTATSLLTEVFDYECDGT
jgi:hypothetical protein